MGTRLIMTKHSIAALACLLVLGCSGGGQEPAERNDPQLDVFDPPPPADSVRVFIATGHTQCNNDGVTLAQTELRLLQAGIDVLSSSCGAITGVAYIAACGGPTPDINLHYVRRANLPDAERVGFRNVTIIGTPTVPGTGYQVVNCR
jgi:hypothetical protein